MSGRDDPAHRIRRALEPWLAADAAVLLAVSGGPDSTALMHAAALARPRALLVATVDHGLRSEAADEARAVGDAAAALGLPHATLRWEGAPPARAIQAEARAARYRLLADHARTVGAALVLTGHTRDDQAETVLMRLIAGSGPAGLAGMRAARPLAEGVTLARPFLGIAKADLVAWCEARGHAFNRDPSNADDRYGRVRLRRLLPLLAAEGLTADRLVTLAERAARDDVALAAAAGAAFAKARLPQAVADERQAPLPVGAGGASRLEATTRTVFAYGDTNAAPCPPGPAGEGGERGAPHAGNALPSPDPPRGSPSAAGGGGEDAAAIHLLGPAIAALPDAVAVRAIDRALDTAGGTLPRRLERLERLVLRDLLPALRSARPIRRTLRGLLIAADAAGRVTIARAPPRRGDGLAAGAGDLLGKGEPSAYIGSACADEPAAAGSRPTRPRD